jgi:hypothetical protein
MDSVIMKGKSVDKLKQVFDVFLGVAPEDAKTIKQLLD